MQGTRRQGAPLDFATPYRLYMKEHLPALYADLRRTGDLEGAIQSAAAAANTQLAEMIEDNGLEDDWVGQKMAAEVVMADLLGIIDALRPADDQPDPEIERQMKALERGDRVIHVAPVSEPHALLASNIGPDTIALPARWVPADLPDDGPEPGATLDAEAQRRWAADYARGLSTGFKQAGIGRTPVTPFKVGVVLAALLLAGAWLMPDHTADAFAGMRPWLMPFALVGGLGCMVGLLPAALFARTRRIGAPGFRVMSWLFALALWCSAWDVTSVHWGRSWATFGLLLFGAPLVPMSLVAAGAEGDWSAAARIGLLVVAWTGTWFAAARLDFLQEVALVREQVLGPASRP